MIIKTIKDLRKNDDFIYDTDLVKYKITIIEISYQNYRLYNINGLYQWSENATKTYPTILSAVLNALYLGLTLKIEKL